MIGLFDTTACLPMTTGVLGLELHLANTMPPETPVILSQCNCAAREMMAKYSQEYSNTHLVIAYIVLIISDYELSYQCLAGSMN